MNLAIQTEKNVFDNSDKRKDRLNKKNDSTFTNLGIAPKILKAIQRLQFSTPTPIQEKAIPAGVKANDVIALAQTGSGKTLAFGIPMLQRLARSKHDTGLVLVPTRELALQVEESLKPICRAVNIRSTVIIGGASMSLQRNALKKNPRVIIATPGRLMDHLERKTIRLNNIEVFVLDEADRMLDMGFVPDIKKIIKSIPPQKQTMLFSATMPAEIESIARELMDDPTRIEVDRTGAAPSEISQEMFFIKHQDKSRLLAHQLQNTRGPVLVFTRTKRMATKLSKKVNAMGFNSAEIHSDRSLAQRRTALEGFKRGRYKILIATDIAARGIDVSGIQLVVNYDLPATSEDYVHRIGRTGRAGRDGHAVSFATRDQRGTIRSLERFMKTKLAVSKTPILPTERSFFKESAPAVYNQKPVRTDAIPQKFMSTNRVARRKKLQQDKKTTFDLSWLKKTTEEFESSDEFLKPDKPIKQNSSKPKKKSKVQAKKSSSETDNTYWSNFKKKRNKKKSVGQGSKRKRRSKK